MKQLLHAGQSTVICKMDTRGHHGDSLNCTTSQCIPVSYGFKPTCPPRVTFLLSSFLQRLTCCKSCVLPSVHSQSVSSALSPSRCQRSASVSMESCEYFYKGASNALSIYFWKHTKQIVHIIFILYIRLFILSFHFGSVPLAPCCPHSSLLCFFFFAKGQ